MSEIKPFSGVDDRVLLANVVPLEAPFTLNIFPSNVCNFKCNYCAQSLEKEKLISDYGLYQENMSIDTMKKIIEQSKEFSKKFKLVSMMGHGEPLCNKQLPQFIEMIKSAGIAERVDIITNASLLTEEFSDRLINAGLDVLRVSLQGITANKYKQICDVNLDFDRFINNLTYFYKKKKQCKVFVKTMDVSLEEGQEQQFFSMFENISDRMYIDNVKPVYDEVTYSEKSMVLDTDRYGIVHERRNVCPQPFYMLSVWANGDVAPCDALYKASCLGNVHSSSLKGMWNSKQLKEFCKIHLRGQKNQHIACSRCCAPDDVAHKEDVLDYASSTILERF